MADRAIIGQPYAAARFATLIRLLLLAVALGVALLAFADKSARETDDARAWLTGLLLGVGLLTGLMAAVLPWFDRTWRLALFQLIDLAWVGAFLYLTGGVQSPGLPLLFAVELSALAVLPVTLPLVVPAMASLALATNALLYVSGVTPFQDVYVTAHPNLVEPAQVLRIVPVQVAALFLVDVLGQVLTRRLRESRALMGDLLDQLGEGVLTCDTAGVVLYANAEAIRLLGLQSEPVGRRANEVLSGNDLEDVRVLMQRPDLPVLERCSIGDGRQLVLRVTPLTDRRGKRAGRVLLVADETRLVLLEESARRSERLASLGEMAAGIAHEVRNPLTSLRGCAQEVAEICATSGSSDAGDLARIMIGEADRLARIVDDVLNYSRLRTPERKAIDLTHFFTDLEALARHSKTEAVPEFIVDVDCPLVYADPDQLRQVLLNLIANAGDAVRGRTYPSITVRAREDMDDLLSVPAIHLSVADNGHGIATEQLERVFTPFHTTKAKGTGLGLPLVQRIIREHEGLVHIESTVGVGTTVTIVLPADSQTRQFRRALGSG